MKMLERTPMSFTALENLARIGVVLVVVVALSFACLTACSLTFVRSRQIVRNIDTTSYQNSSIQLKTENPVTNTMPITTSLSDSLLINK